MKSNDDVIARVADQPEHTELIRKGGLKTGALTKRFRQRVMREAQYENK